MNIVLNGSAPVLMVDDDPDFRLVFQYRYESLTDIQNRLITVESGEACLDYLNSCEKDPDKFEFPEIILMDINMPGMSGIECVRQIRSNERFASVPIVAMLSSSNNPTDIERSLEAGANEYHEKPFNIFDVTFALANSQA